MKTNSTCCGSTTTACDSTIAELPRYYPRQLITPDDLTLEQNYFRDRMRRHNRLLHGWGVVCGALVCGVQTKDANGVISLNTWQVQVQPGYILGPYGDEIILDCVRTVDLRTSGVSGVTGDPCVDVPDPWCSQVTVPPATGPLYIAVKYNQSMTRPVRVQPIGCGCDDTTCECSRWHDGYEIGILNCCPDEQATPPNLDTPFHGDIPNCPACPPQPWVVLAEVNVDQDGNITSIDNCSCRRLVLSTSSLWWRCGTMQGVKVNNAPVKVDPARTDATSVTIMGNNLDEKATFTFGNGVTLVDVIPDANNPHTSIVLNITAKDAAPGYRTLTIVDSECNVAVVPQVIQVQPSAAAVTPAHKQAIPAPTRTAKTVSGKSAKSSPSGQAQNET